MCVSVSDIEKIFTTNESVKFNTFDEHNYAWLGCDAFLETVPKRFSLIQIKTNREGRTRALRVC